jgi:menaquinol-cytochrome c reductase iron-sulfur subunit
MSETSPAESSSLASLPPGESSHSSDPAVCRRSFGKSAAGVLVALAAAGVPFATGIMALLNPLRPEMRAKLRPGGSDDKGFFRVGSVGNIPTDFPQAFTILADRKDGWNSFPSEPIGKVFLCKQGDKYVALNSRCPHAGCDVDYQPAKSGYICPCHDSLFTVEGARSGASPSPRDLDTLDIEIRGEEVWVKFQNFKTGRPDKEAV